MNDYYDGKREMFDERWVSRDDYNDAIERAEAAEHDASVLRDKVERFDKLIRQCEDLEALVEGTLFNLRKASDRLLRSIEMVEEDIELEKNQ